MIARAFDCISLSARSHLGKLRSSTTMTLFSAAAGSVGGLPIIPSEAERSRGISRRSHRHRMSEKILLALSTFPDAEIARHISNRLVSERFAACANILPAVESIYRWKENVENANETLVLFKLREDRQSAFQEKLRSLHPYEVAEIIFVSVSSGLPEYLRWVADNCG
jgi:periplasmic divalent cation tolerance protein